MIDRYSTKEMSKIWSDFNKFKTWEKVELTVAQVMSERGIVPKKSYHVIKKKSKFNVNRILMDSNTSYGFISKI